jgi:methyl-accepting chemotaxis protein
MTSINKKILFAGSISLLVVAGVIITFAAFSTYSSTVSTAEEELANIAAYQAEQVRGDLDKSMSTARNLNSMIQGPYLSGKPLSRESLSHMIGKIIADNPRYNGVYTMWETDAYDKADAKYAGKDGYAASGRLNVYWYRDNGTPTHYEYESDYDDVGQDYTREYYTIPMQSGLPTLTNPYIEEALSPPTLMASTTFPILINNTFVGITGIDVTLADLDRIADETNLYNGRGMMIILSNDGTIAGITGDADLVGKPAIALAPLLGVSQESLQTLNQTTGKGVFSLGKYFGVNAPVIVGDPRYQWSVLVIVPTSVLSEGAISLSIILILFGIIISAAGLIFLSLVARSITRPIIQITDAARIISQGDFSHRINPAGSDEISDLGRAFDVMTSRLEEILNSVRRSGEEQQAVLDEIRVIAQGASSGALQVRGDPSAFSRENQDVIRAINATLDAVVMPLSESMRMASAYANGDFSVRFTKEIPVSGEFIAFRDSMDTIGIQLGNLIGDLRDRVSSLMTEMEESNASVEEIASGSQQLARETTQLSEQADVSKKGVIEIQQSVEELTLTSDKVAIESSDAADLIGQSKKLSEEGTVSSTRAGAGMQAIIASHNDTKGIITEISKEMDEIGNIITIITSIADQTGLLALNAAIEAARAGEAGRGFAVVAGEVKILALESQKSAEKIHEIISSLQKKSALMNTAIVSSSKEILSGDVAVSEILRIFADLDKYIHELNSVITRVKESSTRQTQAIQQVMHGVSVINTSFEATTHGLGNTAALTEESSVALDCISQAINEATISLDHISRKMTKFTITSSDKE